MTDESVVILVATVEDAVAAVGEDETVEVEAAVGEDKPVEVEAAVGGDETVEVVAVVETEVEAIAITMIKDIVKRTVRGERSIDQIVKEAINTNESVKAEALAMQALEVLKILRENDEAVVIVMPKKILHRRRRNVNNNCKNIM
ncbi:exporter of the RND superfamily protein-like protein [Anopheles sinensis]|uniref:Exporter of the RND superfamily protein-like protein n=1 Tax=Anopheles sinensis TaxID=74873 RepID=A0A084W639_ANOSI|nr:exporter of the RND superfamily protein-like protein [Anopheles sinensis]